MKIMPKAKPSKWAPSVCATQRLRVRSTSCAWSWRAARNCATSSTLARRAAHPAERRRPYAHYGQFPQAVYSATSNHTCTMLCIHAWHGGLACWYCVCAFHLLPIILNHDYDPASSSSRHHNSHFFFIIQRRSCVSDTSIGCCRNNMI